MFGLGRVILLVSLEYMVIMYLDPEEFKGLQNEHNLTRVVGIKISICGCLRISSQKPDSEDTSTS